MFKTCGQCNIHKSLDEYHKHKKGKYGHYHICKSCRASNYQRKESHEPQDKYTCTRCRLEKDAESFYKNKTHRSGLSHECKRCIRIQRKQIIDHRDTYIQSLVRQYDNPEMTVKRVKELCQAQKDCCAITGHPFTYQMYQDGGMDFIWNLSILDDHTLVCNFIYSASILYEYSLEQLKDVYKELTKSA
jgi:hypothetical protein